MAIDDKDTEVPSTPVPPTTENADVSATPPDVGKEGDIKAESPTASEPPKVVDDAGDELSPEEVEIMARLTGSKNDEPKTPPTEDKETTGDKKSEEPPKSTEEPTVEDDPTAEDVDGIKLPNSHELAAYKGKTRERIEQFTTKLKEVVPEAQAFRNIITPIKEAGITPEQFRAWNDLAVDLRSKDPARRQFAVAAIHNMAKETGYVGESTPIQAPEPTEALDILKNLEASNDIDPADAARIREALKPKATATKAPATQQTQAPQRDYEQESRIAAQQAAFQVAKANAHEILNSTVATLPATDHATFVADVNAEIARIEGALAQNNRLDEVRNINRFASRMQTAINAVLKNRQQVRRPITPNTQSLSATPPPTSGSTGPQFGTEEYDLALLQGKVSVPQR